MTEIDDSNLQEELDVDSYIEDIKNHGMQEIEYSTKRQPGARYLCPYGCAKLVAMRTIDYHKNNGCSRRYDQPSFTNPDLKKRYYCCGVCYMDFVTRFEFHAHLRIEHDVHPDIHQLHFKDRATFDRFVRWLEMEGGAHFRHKSGSKRRARGRGIFLACNRSGYVNSSQISSSRERTGPFRLGYTCTAYCHATEHPDGHVTAEVCGDHYGHDSRMRLPGVIKYIIAQKQMEGENSSEIIGYLRRNFLPFSHDNIYAQRICCVDEEELKNIFVSSTKKWEVKGIPNKCEIWEEELLDRAGISREGIPRLRDYNEKTTSEIASDEGWPRPRVFVAKVRTDDGSLVPVDVARGEITMDSAVIQNEEFNHEENVASEVDESRYVEIDMDDYGVENFVEDGEVIGQEHQYMIKKSEYGEMEQQEQGDADNASTSEMDKNKHDLYQGDDDDIILRNAAQEVVIVNGDEDVKVGLRVPSHVAHVPHRRCETGQSSSSTLIDGQYSRLTQMFIDEIDAFKMDLLKKADGMPSYQLRSLHTRFRSLHSSLLDKILDDNKSISVFPNRGGLLYRPGRGIDQKMEMNQYAYGRGDVTLLPIEDEMSDDESLLNNNREDVPFNLNIWS